MHWFVWFVYSTAGNFFLSKTKGNCDFSVLAIARHSDKHLSDCCAAFIRDVTRILFSRSEHFDLHFRHKLFVSKHLCGDGFTQPKRLANLRKFVKYISAVRYVVLVDPVLRVVEILKEKPDGCNTENNLKGIYWS